MEIFLEMQDYRVPNQLISKNGKKKKEETEEVDEVSVAANVAGFTGPLGASSEDLKGPGAGPKKKKKSSARWK